MIYLCLLLLLAAAALPLWARRRERRLFRELADDVKSRQPRWGPADGCEKGCVEMVLCPFCGCAYGELGPPGRGWSCPRCTE